MGFRARPVSFGLARSSVWLVPVLFGLWQAGNIFFGEWLTEYPAVFDGAGYIGVARKFLQSGHLDDYRVMRIVPSGVVHVALGLLRIPRSDANIILGFEILNLFSLCAAAYAVQQILRHLGVGARARELGAVLLLVNFAVLKYSVFYPVLTDFAAIGLSSWLLLFYLRRQTIGVALISAVAAFTWPILFLQGLILLVFPVEDRESVRLTVGWRRLLSSLSALWGLGLLLYFVVLRDRNTYTGSIRLEPEYTIVAALFLLPMYFFLPTMSFQRDFFRPRSVLARVRAGRLVTALMLLGAFLYLRDVLVVREVPRNMGIGHFLFVQIVYGVARPLINVVAHTSFYGCLVLLVMFFWKSLGIAVARRGIGLVLAFLANFYLILLASESRQLSNLLPWFVVFLCLVLDRYRLPRYFASGVLILNVVISKVWLPVGEPSMRQSQQMSGGPWMTQETWALQLFVFLAVAATLFFWLFRIRLGGGLRLERAPGFFPQESVAQAAEIPIGLWVGLAAAVPLVFFLIRTA